MFNRFLNHINSKIFFPKGKRILLAVSGGIDSMCLYTLLKKCNIPFAVAHVNHNTRSGMSDSDALFVRESCRNDNIKYHELKVDKSEFVDENFQAKAREIRYDFFMSLGYDLIVTAHHQDDVLESILINFTSGRSVSGIYERIDNIIRPLLIFRKEEIEKYVLDNNVLHIQDSTNSRLSYERNFVRHILLKPMLDRDPDYILKIIGLSERIRQDQNLLSILVHGLVNRTKQEDRIYIPIGPLILYGPTFIFHVLREEGFNRSQATDIFSSINTVGAKFDSHTHELVIDRDNLVVRSKKHLLEEIEFDIQKLPTEINFGNFRFIFTEVPGLDQFGDNVAYFERSSLSDKLSFRTWKKGDSFNPFGMEGHSQTLKKFFTNEKIDILRKQTTPLLINGQDIIWVVPLRTSELYKCDPEAGPFIKVECIVN